MGFNTDSSSANDTRMDTAGATGEKEKELVIVEWRDIIADDFTGESKTDPPVYYGLHAFPSGAVVHVHPCDPVHTCEVESPPFSQISAPK